MNRLAIFNQLKSGREVSLYLIRHGESENNLDRGRFEVGGDCSLTETGVAQIKRLGEALAEEPGEFDHIFCSSFLRSRQSGDILASRLGLGTGNITVSPYLDELGVGEWNGKERNRCLDDIAREKLLSLGKWFATTEGESGLDVQFRAYRWLNAEMPALNLPKEAKIIVCGHGYWIKCLLQLIFGFDYQYLDRIKIGQASVSLVRVSDEGWSLEYLNREPQHL